MDTTRRADLSGVMTWPQGAKMPLVCADQQWRTVTNPLPNDRWLSFGPPMLLHGEGMRNPSVKSGDWTATPQDPVGAVPSHKQSPDRVSLARLK
jgi:hypothetical protein